MTLLTRLGAVLVVVLGTASCTEDKPENASSTESGAPVVQLGGPGETGRTLSPEEAEAVRGPTYTDADIEFVEMMIPHHQQALELTALVEDRAADPDLRVMAERIEVSQADEIAMMEDWLGERQEPEDAGGDHGDHGEHGSDGEQATGEHDHADMPGMLSEEQLDRLAGSTGARFDRLFLQSMIHHHEGAIMMVETLLGGDEGGLESEIFQIASHIGSDQAVEIASMKRQLTRSKL